METNSSQKTTFWKFLENHTIEIPIIQRDYAQGRSGKEYLRKGFLSSLKYALGNHKQLKLDFVYGTNEDGKLYPLDGQQRLTTLWLLHWYIALKSGKLNDEVCNRLKKFTYETRISSREFCDKLCDDKLFDSKWEGSISDYITNQTWFSSAWKQDPTVKSMLVMLAGTKNDDDKKNEDGIEQIFENVSDFWDLLIDDGKCPIVFYYLPISDIGLSDDLYIKMNARGKQLSSFENFKADLVGYIQSKVNNATGDEKQQWEKLCHDFPKKLDTDWTDIFWDNRSNKEGTKEETSRIDEIFYAFLNRFFWNELFVYKKDEKYILEVGQNKELKTSTQENLNPSYRFLNNSDDKDDSTIAYRGLDDYKFYEGEIPISVFEKLGRVLDGYKRYKDNIDNILKSPYTQKEEGNNTGDEQTKQFYFIPRYIEGKTKDNAGNDILLITTINQVERIVFFAVCKYFNEDTDNNTDKDNLKRWMRVIWNLVSGRDIKDRPQIRTTEGVRKAIEFISGLQSHKVYESLAKCTNYLETSDFVLRCKEEINKAKIILGNGQTNSDKEQCIRCAENELKAFYGSIRFVIDVTTNGINCFKLKNARNIITANPDQQKEYLQQLINQCDNEDQLKVIYYGTKDAVWRTNLLNLNNLLIDNFLTRLNATTTSCNNNSLYDILCRLVERIDFSKDLFYRLRESNNNYKYVFSPDYSRDEKKKYYIKENNGQYSVYQIENQEEKKVEL